MIVFHLALFTSSRKSFLFGFAFTFWSKNYYCLLPGNFSNMEWSRPANLKALPLFKRIYHTQQYYLYVLRGGYTAKNPTNIWHQCIAEFFGVMFIVIFGVGSVCTAITTGAQQGLWQVAVVWGFGVSLAIYFTASISGAHLNPAVSLAFAIFRPESFPWLYLIPFWIAQFLGGFAGGGWNYLWFNESFRNYEQVHNIVRGSPESVATAAAFGEYFPNPGANLPSDLISSPKAMFIEAWGTGILMFAILALTDPRHKLLVLPKPGAPFLIGFTVAVLISIYAPYTQAGFNPARDFGPRLVACIAGWGSIAIPGPKNGFWVYIVGPVIGAPLGAAVYDFILARGLRRGVFLDEKIQLSDDEYDDDDLENIDLEGSYPNLPKARSSRKSKKPKQGTDFDPEDPPAKDRDQFVEANTSADPFSDPFAAKGDSPFNIHKQIGIPNLSESQNGSNSMHSIDEKI